VVPDQIENLFLVARRPLPIFVTLFH
jgi:hypothetical protein